MTNRLARMTSFGTKPRYRLISLDLDNASEAIEIARKLAEQSGQKVALCGEDGEILYVSKSAARN
jgi:hypothetical protein